MFQGRLLYWSLQAKMFCQYTPTSQNQLGSLREGCVVVHVPFGKWNKQQSWFPWDKKSVGSASWFVIWACFARCIFTAALSVSWNESGQSKQFRNVMKKGFGASLRFAIVMPSWDSISESGGTRLEMGIMHLQHYCRPIHQLLCLPWAGGTLFTLCDSLTWCRCWTGGTSRPLAVRCRFATCGGFCRLNSSLWELREVCKAECFLVPRHQLHLNQLLRVSLLRVEGCWEQWGWYGVGESEIRRRKRFC